MRAGFNPGFDRYRASGKKHGVRRREVVNPSAENKKLKEDEQVGPAEEAVFPSLATPKKIPESCKAYGRGEGMHQQRLLADKPEPGDMRVLILVHVSEYFWRRPMIFDLPQKIGKKQHERNERASPNPHILQKTALRCHQQCQEKAESKEER